MKRFKPKTDKLFYIIAAALLLLLAVLTVVCAVYPVALWSAILSDLFVLYFLVSPLFGYVELRESSVFIKFGLLLKREVPYSKIRGFSKERRFYSDSMLSLKNSLEHVNIKYNTFDIVSVSVRDNDALIREIEARR